jgi:iron complex transport system permease protein
VPHALRPLVGVEHRRLVPAAALAGGAFLVACDVIARVPGRELPLGVVTGLIGAPVFLGMLVRQRRAGAYG